MLGCQATGTEEQESRDGGLSEHFTSARPCCPVSLTPSPPRTHVCSTVVTPLDLSSSPHLWEKVAFLHALPDLSSFRLLRHLVYIPRRNVKYEKTKVERKPRPASGNKSNHFNDRTRFSENLPCRS